MKVTSNPIYGRYHFHFHHFGVHCRVERPAPCTACGWGLCTDCFGKFCGCSARGHR